MIRTIVFDFGNVVAFFDHGRAVARMARYTDRNPVELAIELYGSTIEHDYECGRITTAEYVREAMLNGRLHCTPDEFLDCFNDIFWANPEVGELVPKLKPQYRLVLASNTNEAHFGRYTREFAGVLSHFEDLVASHIAGARKPDPQFFLYTSQFLKAEPHECVFVDDLGVNVEAAERLGWKGVIYRPDGTLAEKLGALGVQFA